MDAFADHWDFRRQPLEVWRAYSTDTHRYDPSLWWLVEDGDELAAISIERVGLLGRSAVWLDPGARRAAALAQARARDCAPSALVSRLPRPRRDEGRARRGRREHDRSGSSLRERRHAPGPPQRHVREDAVSRLRARCPDCRTFTAVAIGPGYECHACGREFGAGPGARPAGLGRGRRGDGRGRAPAAAVSRRRPSSRRTRSTSRRSRSRSTCPSGRSSSAAAAARTSARSRALAARHDRLALVWIDAHGDLNTPESSPVREPRGACRSG